MNFLMKIGIEFKTESVNSSQIHKNKYLGFDGVYHIWNLYL